MADNTVLPTWAGMHVGVDVGVQAGPADVAPKCGAEASDETRWRRLLRR